LWRQRRELIAGRSSEGTSFVLCSVYRYRYRYILSFLLIIGLESEETVKERSDAINISLETGLYYSFIVTKRITSIFFKKKISVSAYYDCKIAYSACKEK
jgi:hypothetical protein